MAILSSVLDTARLLGGIARDLLLPRAELLAENLALRQQLAILKQSSPRPSLRASDRYFWNALSRLWPGWRRVLVVVQPQTVIRWHRMGFRAYWRRRSKAGRPATRTGLRAHNRRMASENPTWGAPRIHAELQKLGFKVAERTVRRYLAKLKRPNPSERQRQSWRNFLANHRDGIVAMDFVAVPTATFRTLYLWFAIEHGRRSILHFGVTDRPHAEWVDQHLRETFPFETRHEYLISDNDPVFQRGVPATIRALGLEHKKITPRSPWQNGVAERMAGTFRRELLDHVIVLNEQHLYRLVAEYVAYYNNDRCHLSLDKDAPVPRPTERGPPDADIVALPRVGGLHHRYTRKAA
ncbi:MAG: integrase core domain-containing protein [Myxococcales bacterium]|nr:integrase core domain-containing protein [Myxococcales bacterium]MCB9651064.1 transposase [Deltaproteobacteria bacterium]